METGNRKSKVTSKFLIMSNAKIMRANEQKYRHEIDRALSHSDVESMKDIYRRAKQDEMTRNVSPMINGHLNRIRLYFHHNHGIQPHQIEAFVNSRGRQTNYAIPSVKESPPPQDQKKEKELGFWSWFFIVVLVFLALQYF
jgi:hypothetical protein